MATAATEAPARRYLTWGDASTYTGLSEATLRRLVAAGRLHLLMPVERCPRLDRLELDQLMHGGAGDAPTPPAAAGA
jgi:excisionase family DNA binding protein